MLIGEYTHSIDDKGRTSLPAKFKGQMGQTVIITRGIDSCLSVYTVDSWKKLTEKLLENLSITKTSDRDFNRYMLSGAVEVSIDKQGRVLIPNHLRDFASLDKKVVWTGVGDKAEIWSEKKWTAYLAKNTKNPEQLASALEGVI